MFRKLHKAAPRTFEATTEASRRAVQEFAGASFSTRGTVVACGRSRRLKRGGDWFEYAIASIPHIGEVYFNFGRFDARWEGDRQDSLKYQRGDVLDIEVRVLGWTPKRPSRIEFSLGFAEENILGDFDEFISMIKGV